MTLQLCLIMFGLGWLIANFVVWRTNSSGALLALAIIGSFPNGLFYVIPAVLYLWLILVMHFIGSRWFEWSLPRFAPASLLLGVVCLGVTSLSVLHAEAQLQAKYPLESMPQRLASRSRPIPAGVILSGTHQWLDNLDNDDGRERVRWNAQYRRIRLQNLHENTVYQFVNSPGFGVTRMMHGGLSANSFNLQINEDIDDEVIEDQPSEPQQRGPHADWRDSESPLVSVSAQHWAAKKLHLGSVLQFAPNLERAIYWRDRDHVAGFVSHGFRRLPEPVNGFRVVRLELIGLNTERGPVVYVSESLPQMTQLRETPTRPLDRFERSAFERLGEGGMVLAADVGTDFRAMGAIRAGANCTKCHGCERGDLLGAFSYTLARTGR